ncbi:hypothetical protein FD755_019363, partial [Muntiacus reevesi]
CFLNPGRLLHPLSQSCPAPKGNYLMFSSTICSIFFSFIILESKYLKNFSQLHLSHASPEVWSLSHWSIDWLSVRFGTVIAIGATLFVIAVVTVIVCCTCSCCCLYKMCRRPSLGYHSVLPKPGMPTAPYPTQPMGAALPYPASQPPYNPAYMEPPKAVP